MTLQFLYRAFHAEYSSGVNSASGFYAGVEKSSRRSRQRQTVARHLDRHNTIPTPWISTSSDLLRAIKRAVQLAERHGSNGVSIAVIDLEECDDCEFYNAADLADTLDIETNHWNEEEYLFRWAIPGDAIVSCLSLETLDDRGLYDVVPELLTRGTVEMWKRRIMENWLEDRPARYSKEVGRMAARVAFLFGDGVHTVNIGLEAAEWWEESVGRDVKRSFYRALERGTDDPECFD